MSHLMVDTLASPWAADPTGLWSLSVSAAASRFGEDGLGMAIVARSGSDTDPAPFVERRLDPPIDLRGAEELRFWLRSSRPGDDGHGKPLYLAFEASGDAPAPGLSWRWLRPIPSRIKSPTSVPAASRCPRR
jgi:hypothetical protein